MENININPLNDRVLVKYIEIEDKTSNGIIIPATVKDKTQEGIVIAVGPGKYNRKMTVKIGDRILYGKYSGTEITIYGKEYLIMHESDIYAIINNK